MKRLILRSDCVDSYSLRLHPLQILNEVMRIRRELFTLQATADQRFICLHPCRSRPRRSKDLDTRSNRKNLFQYRDDTCLVRTEVKLCERLITPTCGKIVIGKGVIVHIRRTHTHAETTDANRTGLGIEQLMQ